MSEWKTYKLGKDVVTKLGDGLHGTPVYNDNGEYYFINGSNLVDGKIVINSNTKKVTEVEFIKYKKDLSDKTILLGINGTIGNVALYNNEICILGKSAAYLNINDDFDKQFIRYVLTNDHFQNYIKNNASGTTIKNVGLGLLREYEFSAPEDKAKQQEIAQILTSLDDKIELNLQMNQTLEAMAQAIFKEWFVEFNYPLSEPLINDDLLDEPDLKNEKSSKSFNQKNHSSDNYPKSLNHDSLDSLDEPDLKNEKSSKSFNQKNHSSDKLPKGWRMGKLGEMVDAKGGTTPSTAKEEFWNGDFFWTTPKDLSNIQAPVLIDTERKITELGLRQISSGVMPKGTLLLSSRAPIGYIAISQVPISINQGYIAIQGKLVSNLFMLFWLKQNMDTVKSKANGSTFQEISKSNFREIETIIPSNEILKQFDEMANPIFEKIVENVFQIRTLTATRDTLLPKLMSGKISLNCD
ncbi:MAG: restriction endonuclease subunit S [Bacteroidetes bacterium]|nr:restriction endonuclease subunit S [Bacteroidota bacterium]